MSEVRLKIGFFIDSFFPMIDGVVNVVDNYAKEMSKYADVYVFAPKSRELHKDDYVYKVVRCRKIKVPFTDYDLAIPRMDDEFMDQLNKIKLDIVHVHSPFSIGKIGISYAKKHQMPCLLTIHSQHYQDFYLRTKSHLISKMIHKRIVHTMNLADACYGVNQSIVDIYRKFGVKNIVGILPNGTDLMPSHIHDDENKLKEQYNIDDNTKVLLFVGRIDKVKNVYFLIDSLRILKEKKFKFKMFFVGVGPDFKKVMRVIKKYSLDDAVVMVGKIKDRDRLRTYYQLADLFVFPSLYDTNSLVQIEAASQKTPTLFIRNSVTSSTINENISGYLTELNKHTFAEKIIEIFNDVMLYESVSKGAYNLMYKNWSEIALSSYHMYLTYVK